MRFRCVVASLVLAVGFLWGSVAGLADCEMMGPTCDIQCAAGSGTHIAAASPLLPPPAAPHDVQQADHRATAELTVIEPPPEQTSLSA